MLGEIWDNIVIPKENSVTIQLDHSWDRAKRTVKVLGLILGKRFGKIILLSCSMYCSCVCTCACVSNNLV